MGDVQIGAKGGVLPPNSLKKITPDFAKDVFEITVTLTQEGYFEAKFPDGYVKHYDLEKDYGRLMLSVITTLGSRYDLPPFKSQSTIEEAKKSGKFIFTVSGV